MTWYFNDKPVEEMPEGCVGFVYLITNLTNNKNFNAAIWLLNLEKSFSIFNLKFFHKNNGIQEINGNNQLIVKSNTGLKLPILRNIYLSYELQVDWEKKPSSNKKKTDKINYFTLGYEW